MKLSERLKLGFWRLNYRMRGGYSAAFIITDEKKKNDFERLCDRVAAETVPCLHSLDEVREYISEKYGAEMHEMTEGARRIFKANVIQRHFPEVLSVAEVKLRDDGKMPSRREMREYTEASQARFKEALGFSEDALGLKISHFEFEYVTKSGKRIPFSVTTEDRSGELSVEACAERNTAAECAADGNGTHRAEDEADLCRAEDETELRRVAEDIVVFRGVSAEDIENRTERFMGYAYIISGA